MRLVRAVHRLWLRFLPFQLVIIIGGIGLATGLTCAMTIVLLKGQVHNVPLPNSKPQPTPTSTAQPEHIFYFKNVGDFYSPTGYPPPGRSTKVGKK